MVLPQAATAVVPNLGVDDGRLTLAGWSPYFLVSSGQTTSQTAMTHFTSLASESVSCVPHAHNQLLIYVSFFLLPPFYFPYFLSLQISQWQLTWWLPVQGLSQSTRPQALWRRCNENWIHNSPFSPGTGLKNRIIWKIPFPWIAPTASFFYKINISNGRKNGKVITRLKSEDS